MHPACPTDRSTPDASANWREQVVYRAYRSVLGVVEVNRSWKAEEQVSLLFRSQYQTPPSQRSSAITTTLSGVEFMASSFSRALIGS